MQVPSAVGQVGGKTGPTIRGRDPAANPAIAEVLQPHSKKMFRRESAHRVAVERDQQWHIDLTAGRVGQRHFSGYAPRRSANDRPHTQ